MSELRTAVATRTVAQPPASRHFEEITKRFDSLLKGLDEHNTRLSNIADRMLGSPNEGKAGQATPAPSSIVSSLEYRLSEFEQALELANSLVNRLESL